MDGVGEALVLQPLGVGQVDRVLAKDGRHHVPIGARRSGVDGGLVVFEADAKPRLAATEALARRRVRLPAAAASLVVAAMLVAEVLQSQLEVAGTVNLRTDKAFFFFYY